MGKLKNGTTIKKIILNNKIRKAIYMIAFQSVYDKIDFGKQSYGG